MYAFKIRTLIFQYVPVNKTFFQALRAQHTKQNYYETLNLKPNCTAKDIRDSFVKLSKENHPDTGNNTRQNVDKFRAIIEAYNVLGKAESRAVYDSVMNQDTGPYRMYNYPESSESYQKEPSSDARYYGVFGSKKVSNGRIALYCIIFMVAGAIIQAFAIRRSITFRRDKLDRLSMEAGKIHSKCKADAIEYGIDYQLEKLAHKSMNDK